MTASALKRTSPFTIPTTLAILAISLKEQNLDEKAFPIRSVLSAISASKDRYEGPEVFRKKAEAANDWKNTRIAKI